MFNSTDALLKPFLQELLLCRNAMLYHLLYIIHKHTSIRMTLTAD